MSSVSSPTSGLSEVMGIMADTVFRNMVNERRIVTPSSTALVRAEMVGSSTRQEKWAAI